MVDRWGHAPQMRHDSGNLRRSDILPRLRQFGLPNIERHFLNFNRLSDCCANRDVDRIYDLVNPDFFKPFFVLFIKSRDHHHFDARLFGAHEFQDLGSLNPPPADQDVRQRLALLDAPEPLLQLAGRDPLPLHGASADFYVLLRKHGGIISTGGI